MDATSVERRTLPGLTSGNSSVSPTRYMLHFFLTPSFQKPQHIVIKRETEIEVLADYELGVSEFRLFTTE